MKTNISITDRYADSIRGITSCFDRLILQGTLNPVGHPDGMTSYLYAHHIRIFDFPQFAQGYTTKIRDHIAQAAKSHDIEISFVRNHSDRKENIVAQIIKTRGDHPGLVGILSAMEACSTFQPWHDKKTGKTFLRHNA